MSITKEMRKNIRYCLLPYGKWTCEGGRQVLFNRRYVPIWQKDLINGLSQADPSEWIIFDKSKTVHFYLDSSPQKAARAIKAYELFTGELWDWEEAKDRMRTVDVRLTKSVPYPGK
jgi:hypothetical protein